MFNLDERKMKSALILGILFFVLSHPYLYRLLNRNLSGFVTFLDVDGSPTEIGVLVMALVFVAIVYCCNDQVSVKVSNNNNNSNSNGNAILNNNRIMTLKDWQDYKSKDGDVVESYYMYSIYKKKQKKFDYKLEKKFYQRPDEYPAMLFDCQGVSF